MLNYNHLHYFHMTATEGSVAGAAERLGVTQPTVSEQVRALERTLGVTLFERAPTGLKLTDAGRLAFEHTSVMFRAGERLVESLGHTDRDVPRALRVGLGASVARATTTTFMMPLLAIDDCIPAIRIGETPELIRELRGSTLDLVLCESEPPEASRRGLEIEQVAKTTLVGIAPPSFSPEPDWKDVRLLQYRESSSIRWDIETFLESNSYHPTIAAEVDDSLFLVEAAARGGYVAFVPRSIARDAVAAGRVQVFTTIEAAHSGVYALYQESASVDLARRAVQLLIEAARKDD